jgi:hypothetical protein
MNSNMHTSVSAVYFHDKHPLTPTVELVNVRLAAAVVAVVDDKVADLRAAVDATERVICENSMLIESESESM